MSKLDEQLIHRAERALLIAKAHRDENQALEGSLPWAQARNQWQKAVAYFEQFTNSPDEDFERLAAYCQQALKHTQKKELFQEAKGLSDPRTAAGQYSTLCQNPILRHDWEVWYRYGRHCLETVIAWLKDQIPLSTDLDAYTIQARDSLRHAQALIKDSSNSTLRVGDINPGWHVADQLQLLAQWEPVLTAERSIRQVFRLQDPSLTIGSLMAQSAVQAYEQGQKATQGAESNHEAAHTLDQLWRHYRTTALAKLWQQVESPQQPQTLFELVDDLSAILILDTSNQNARARLRTVFNQAVDSLAQQAESHVSDDSGLLYKDYYLRTYQKPASDMEVASGQLILARELESHSHNLEASLIWLADEVQRSQLKTRLLQIQERLKKWQELLQPLVDKLRLAKELADDGLRAPDQFDEARYILRVEQAHGVHQPIETVFTEKHVGVQALREYLNKQHKRRQRQQELANTINALLQREYQLIKLGQRSSTQSLSDSERQQLKEYPSHLQTTLATLKQMHDEEPGDPCHLQLELEYTPSDMGQSALYRELVTIEQILGMKLEQYNTAKVWLQARDPDGNQIIAWQKAIEQIRSLRDYSQTGLRAAQAFAWAVIGSSPHTQYTATWLEAFNPDLPIAPTWRAKGIFDGKLSLTAARERLDNTEWQAFLIQNLPLPQSNQRVNPVGQTHYAIVEVINLDRQADLQIVAGRITAIEQEINNIEWRLQHFKRSWAALEHAYFALMSITEFPWWRRWWRSTSILDSPEYAAFLQAKNDFCQICPEYTRFKDILADVTREKGVPPLSCNKSPDVEHNQMPEST